MKKIEAIKELIAKGELTPDALRWKVRRYKSDDKEMKAEKRALLREQGIKDEDGEGSEEEDVDGESKVYMLKRDGTARAIPCRWSVHEAQTFIEILKRDGKKWAEIAEQVATKNEQQCRTRGLVLWNKLRKHCWDKELFEVLKPSGKPGR